MIEVTSNEDNTLTITWDKTSPTESILNTWTEEDFIRVIMDAVEKPVEDPEQ
jgi:hypothetical protein